MHTHIWMRRCHNPFSIQVYYYENKEKREKQKNLTKSQSLFNSGLLLLGFRFAITNWPNLSVTIPFQFRSIITFIIYEDTEGMGYDMSQSLFNSGLLLRWMASLRRARHQVCHNPFSIQVYYYVKQCFIVSGEFFCHNPFSIQVYYYKRQIMNGWGKMFRVTIPFQFRSIITRMMPRQRFLKVCVVTIPFQFRSIITRFELAAMMGVHIASQSLFNSGLLLQ